MENSRKIIFALTFMFFVLSAKAAELNNSSSSSTSTSYTGNEQEDVITVNNTTNHDFWIVIKYGGKLVPAKQGGLLIRQKGQGEKVLFSDKLPAKSSNKFNKQRYDNLTVRIFANENNYKAYKGGIYGRALNPSEVAGLKEILLVTINQQYYIQLKYNFIGFECPICFETIKKNDQVGVLDPCGHKYHLACINSWQTKNPTCPECRKNITKIITKNAEIIE